MPTLLPSNKGLRLLGIAVSLGVMLSLSGCAAVVIGAVGASAVTVSEDSRTVGTQIDDTTLGSRVSNAISKDENLTDQTNISVHVFNGSVLLVGQSPDALLARKAENLVMSVGSVRRVFNQIRIGKPTAATTRAYDLWLASKVRASLLAEKEIDFLKMNIAVEDSEVFLMGIVTSAEASKTIDVVRNLDGVVKVVNVFDIKN